MKEVWIINEENHGLIGIADTLWGVAYCLDKEKWLSIKDFDIKLACTDVNAFIEKMELEHGIYLEKRKKYF